MSDFKKKMERQLIEEKEARIKQEMNRCEADIKRLEKIGNTENTFLKLFECFFSFKDNLNLFLMFILSSQMICCFLCPYIHDFVLSEIFLFSLIFILLILLIYWNISIKRLNKYLNKLIYQEIQELETTLEGVKEQLRREIDN